MSQSQGIVTSLGGDGNAEVLIQAGQTGCIPGAPDVEVCQCSGCSSNLTIKTVNKAGAAIGDLVYVSHVPGTVIRNIAILLGIPLMGLIFGTLLSIFLYERFTIPVNDALLLASAGLLLGMIVAVINYRRVSADNQPVITDIIKTGLKAPTALRAIDPVCKMEVSTATAAASLVYENMTYYFCQSGCLEAFVKDPIKYVENIGGPV